MKVSQKLRLALVACILAVGSILPSASPALATGPDTLAGRPITGDASYLGWCQGTVYGRVNSYLVLFTAGHCRDGRAEGDPVYDVLGREIGTWSECCGGYGTVDDLGYIRLLSNWYPADPSLVYRGGGTYFRNTSHWADEADCSVIPGDMGGQLDQVWEPSWSSTDWFRYTSTGNFMVVNDGWRCQIHLGLPWHGGSYKDSGSGLWVNDVPNQVVGVARGADGDGHVVFQSLHSGIRDYDIYWKAHGGNLGAWFCTSASCA